MLHSWRPKALRCSRGRAASWQARGLLQLRQETWHFECAAPASKMHFWDVMLMGLCSGRPLNACEHQAQKTWQWCRWRSHIWSHWRKSVSVCVSFFFLPLVRASVSPFVTTTVFPRRDEAFMRRLLTCHYSKSDWQQFLSHLANWNERSLSGLGIWWLFTRGNKGIDLLGTLVSFGCSGGDSSTGQWLFNKPYIQNVELWR